MSYRTCTYLDPHNIKTCTECGQGLELCTCVGLDDLAHERNHSPDGIVIKMVRGELVAAREESPGDLHQLPALVERVGKLAQGMMEHDRDGSCTIQEVLRRAVQAAAMAIRVATDGDANFAYLFPVVEEELPKGPVARQYD